MSTVTAAPIAPPPVPAELLAEHWAELQASAIAADVAAANVASWGTGTDRHWESERAELVRHARRQIQTESVTGSGKPQWQAGELAGALIRLDQRHRGMAAGGWRSLSEALPGLPVFDQWKPNQPRQKGRRDPRTGEWSPQLDQSGRPVPVKYEAPPGFPDGGGLLLPRVPERCWQLICEQQDLPFPADRSGGFWAWALVTPGLQLLICEGWKKALAAVSAGWAAVALPGVQMGRRRGVDGSERLIGALELLAAPGRPWLIVFDAEAKPSTAAKVAAAAGALARALRSAGGRVEIARLPLLPGAEKTGLDDLLAIAGPEALDRALSDTGPRAVLPRLGRVDRTAPAGQWLGVACPLPSPEAAPLVTLQAPMGSGKSEAIATAVAPGLAAGVPLLLPSHRVALGRALAERLGVAWAPAAGDDQRLIGAGFCLDSCCPASGLQISGHGWSGAVLVLDEWQQALEHLLLSNGTALAKRRGAVLRTLAELIARSSQTIAADAQLSNWAVTLLERLSGRRALVIASEHQPMAGRSLHCREGLTTPVAASAAFRVKWRELVLAGRPFLCWTSAQQAGMSNAPQTLAALHRRKGRRTAATVAPALAAALAGDSISPPMALTLALAAPEFSDLIDVIDSSTPELAAELAADPDGFAERRTAEAERLGVSWALYCSPSISSGISFSRWRPAAVIALAGGRIAPEHVVQAVARVRCPEVPAYLFAPERAPGAALRVGSGAVDPTELIDHLRAVTDPLLGQLEAGDAEGAWLAAWAELGAVRNRQHFAYRATIAGLLQSEGWQLQAPEPEPADAEGIARAVTERLREIAQAAQDAEDQAVINAEPLSDQEAAELERRRRRLEPNERAALDRFRLGERWALEGAPPSQALIDADRDGLRDRLRLGWLLSCPEALALIPSHDQAAIAALDPTGRPFAPDRLRVALAPRVTALQALGLPRLLERFAAGEVIAATDPAVVGLHAAATTHRAQLAAAAGVSPGVKATGTLRALLAAVGWRLERAGRINARTDDRGALTYRAERVALPAGVDALALAAAWLAELQAAIAALDPTGALFAPTENPYRGKKCATGDHGAPPPPRPWPLVPAAAVPWPSPPPSHRRQALHAA